MTVINKLEQTLEMLKSCESNFNTFSLDTNDENAKQSFKQMAQNIKACVDMLQNRVNYVASQEPQYKQELEGTQNMQNQSQDKNAEETPVILR
jgi:hypothetical protein